MVTRSVTTSTMASPPKPVDLLILGAGWTSTFLIPLLQSHSIPFAATSTTGRDNTIPFRFDPSSTSTEPFTSLPSAQTVLITFPLKDKGQSRTLVELYEKTRSATDTDAQSKQGKRLYIQLGSTGIFTAPHWNNYKSSHDTANARAIAEDELLSLPSSSSTTTPFSTTVLNLSGLYGGARDPKAWLPRIIKSKKDIAVRKALHLVHGHDVARAVLGAHGHPEAVSGNRWIVTDLHVYDWWELVFEWAGVTGEPETRQKGEENEGGEVIGERKSRGIREMELEGETVDLQEAVLELMEREGVRALPRGPESLGRVLDGRDFWRAVASWPAVGRVT